MIETKCDVTESTRNFEYWSSARGLSDSTRKNLLNADIAVVPWEKFRDHSEPLFPVGTSDLFEHLKQSLPAGDQIELAVEDQDYWEISLHSDIIRIATVVVKDAALGVLLNLLATWIAKRIWPDSPGTPPEVHASVIVVQTDGTKSKSVQISYEGPAATFEATVQKAFESTCVPNPVEPKDPAHEDAVDSRSAP